MNDSDEPTPAAADAMLEVLVRRARDLADLGTVRLQAGSLSVELTTAVAPARRNGTEGPAPAPVLAAAVVGADRHSPPEEHPQPVGDAEGNGHRPGVEITSTTVGVFYRASSPGAAPFVVEGDLVSVGQQIGLVEAMKLMIPLETDRAGRVEEFFVANGEAVEHGQAVLRLVPA